MMSATTPSFPGVFGVQSHYIAFVDWNLPCRLVLELTAVPTASASPVLGQVSAITPGLEASFGLRKLP